MASDQQRQDDLLIVSGVFTSLSIIVVAMRTIVRGCLIRRMGLDDWFIILAMIFTAAYFASFIVNKQNHVGFPMSTLTLNNMEALLKTTLSVQLLYFTIIFFVKLSILCMYLRFAVSETFRFLSNATIAFHVVFLIICLVTILLQCRPLHKMWDVTGTVPGTCINRTAFFYFAAGFNILSDIWILVLPIKTLSNINRPRKEKIALLAIFGAGLFACVTSIVRLHSIYTYTLAEDPFKNSLKVNIWSMLEVNIAIICASVPGLKPLFTPRKLREAMSVSLTYPTSSKTPTSLRSCGPGGSNNHHHEYQLHSKKCSGTSIAPNSINTSCSFDKQQQSLDIHELDPMPSLGGGVNQIHVQHFVSVESTKGERNDDANDTTYDKSKMETKIENTRMYFGNEEGESSSTENILHQQLDQ